VAKVMESDFLQAGAYALENGHANFIGFGGQAFANQDFAKDILSEGTIVSGKICITGIKSLELMRSMLPFGCVLRAKAYAQLYQYYIKNNG